MTIDPRIYEQFNAHKKAPFRLEEATILVLAMVGSHSHGTYIPPEDPNAVDDVDFMGVVIPPPSYTFGLKEWDGLNFQFEELDCVFYSFRKFVNLLIKSNPNVMGLLWLRDEHYIHRQPDLWNWMVAQRGDFASENAYEAFVGYADSQIRKMVNFDIVAQNTYDEAVKLTTAAGWTEEQIVKNQHRPMPDMTAVGVVLDELGGWRGFPRDPGHDKLCLDSAVKEVVYAHAKFFQGYMGQKRKNLIRKYGYDVKNAAHLIRLLRMLVDYLKTGQFQVYRTNDAQLLKDMKQGKYKLEEVRDMAIQLTHEAEEASKTSILPPAPNVYAIDQLVQDVYLNAYGLEKV